MVEKIWGAAQSPNLLDLQEKYKNEFINFEVGYFW